MKFLVIGLGSMGKRRIRNLISLGYKDSIAGFDLRKDRREEAEKYSIEVFGDFELAMNKHSPEIFIISTPPNLHMKYAFIAEKRNIHCFLEASVVDSEKILELSKMIENKNLLMAPSCTMRYYFAPIKIKELVQNKTIGKVINYNYQTGQYLPDWHPWEKIEDFYVSNPDTGGCREIVPFELTWLNDIFGSPNPLACVRKKLTNIPAKIDDIYHCILEYPENIIGNLTIETISKPCATREMRILGTKGEICYSADSNVLRYINDDMKEWKKINLKKGTVEKEYINPEEPYIEEIRDFIEAVLKVKQGNKSSFPNTLRKDYDVLQILYKLEDISESKNDLSR